MESGREKPLSEASVRTETRNIKGLFKFAVKQRYIRTNPFDDLPSASIAAEKDRDITPEEVQRLIDNCPGWQWRTFVGLMFYLGLRAPSETHSLKWSDIDWDRRKITIDAPKTGIRVAPIRPELMTLLDEAFEAAEEGAVTILEGFPKNNRHRQMHKIIRLAKVEPWSDLFQHARRCCRTRFLTEGHPPHAVSRWMGHGQAVGDKHYSMVSEESFDRVSGARSRKRSSKSQHRNATGCTIVKAEIEQRTKKPAFVAKATKHGLNLSSPAWARTRDTWINSPLLYQLSYRGSRYSLEGDQFRKRTWAGQGLYRSVCPLSTDNFWPSPTPLTWPQG